MTAPLMGRAFALRRKRIGKGTSRPYWRRPCIRWRRSKRILTGICWCVAGGGVTHQERCSKTGILFCSKRIKSLSVVARPARSPKRQRAEPLASHFEPPETHVRA
jgi:hypothetical protein